MKFHGFELDLNALAAVFTAVGALIMAIKALIMTLKKRAEKK